MSLTELFRFFILLLLGPSIYFCKSTPRGSSSIYNNPNSIRKSPTQPTSGYSSPLRSDGIPERRPLSEYSIYSLYTQPENDRDKKLAQEREQLYEAYNLLHTLAQVCSFCFNFIRRFNVTLSPSLTLNRTFKSHLMPLQSSL